MMLTLRPIKEDGSWGSKKKGVYELDPETGERIPVIDPKSGLQKKDKNGRLQWKRLTVPSTDWNSPETFNRWRTGWADACNRELERMGVDRLSEKSYKDRGITQEATVHEGYIARQIEAQGGRSERCELNRAIRRRNSLLQEIHSRLAAIQNEITRLIKIRGRALQKLLDAVGDREGEHQDISR